MRQFYASRAIDSKMEDYIRGKDELVVPCTIVIRSRSVGMIKSKLGAYGNYLVRPPGDADGMLGIVRGKAGPAADSSLIYSLRTVRNVFRASRNMV